MEENLKKLMEKVLNLPESDKKDECVDLLADILMEEALMKYFEENSPAETIPFEKPKRKLAKLLSLDPRWDE